jgi:hypothetical protein
MPNNLSRRHLVAAAAALPALAMPSVAGAVVPSIVEDDELDRAAIIARACELVECLGKTYVREGWKLDETRAAQFIEAVRTIDYGASECPQMSIIRDWAHDHGQSLDWLILGDPGVMICRAARAAAPPGAISVVDPRFAAIEAHRAAWNEHNDKCSDLDALGTPEALVEDDRLHDVEERALAVLLDIEAATRKGAAALLRYVADLELRGEGRKFEADLTLAKYPYPIGSQYGSPSYYVQHNVADFLLIAEA